MGVRLHHLKNYFCITSAKLVSIVLMECSNCCLLFANVYSKEFIGKERILLWVNMTLEIYGPTVKPLLWICLYLFHTHVPIQTRILNLSSISFSKRISQIMNVIIRQKKSLIPLIRRGIYAFRTLYIPYL